MRLRLAMSLTLFSAPLAAQAAPAAPAAEPAAALWSKLERRIGALDAQLDGVLAVAIKDLSDGRTLLLHADAVLPTASTIKIAVLAELYRQDAAGGAGGPARLADGYVVDSADVIDPGDLLARLTPGVTRLSNRDLAALMVSVSDNSATNVLIRRVGMERVNALLASLGLQDTRLRRRMLDLAAARAGRENTATPRELVTLLEALWNGRVLRGPARDDFFRILAAPKDRYLPRLLPDDARLASKPGWLEGVRVDAGIGFAPNRPFAIAVMISYAGDDHAAEQAIAEIGRAAWEHFARLGGGGSYGRRMP